MDLPRCELLTASNRETTQHVFGQWTPVELKTELQQPQLPVCWDSALSILTKNPEKLDHSFSISLLLPFFHGAEMYITQK